MTARGWSPDSWRAMPIRQVPEYPDHAALAAMEGKIARFPPLVFAGEARRLRAALARAGDGEAFVLQGGDCAESFLDLFAAPFRQTSVVTIHGIMGKASLAKISGREVDLFSAIHEHQYFLGNKVLFCFLQCSCDPLFVIACAVDNGGLNLPLTGYRYDLCTVAHISRGHPFRTGYGC